MKVTLTQNNMTCTIYTKVGVFGEFEITVTTFVIINDS